MLVFAIIIHKSQKLRLANVVPNSEDNDFLLGQVPLHRHESEPLKIFTIPKWLFFLLVEELLKVWSNNINQLDMKKLKIRKLLYK